MAVSISTGSWPSAPGWARSWRHTCRPSASGSIRSKMSSSGSGGCCKRARPLAASAQCASSMALCCRYCATMSARRWSSSIIKIRVLMGSILSALHWPCLKRG